MIRVLVILAAIGTSVGGYFAYRSYSRQRDLEETLQWMEHTYNPHEGGSNYGLGHGTETHYIEHSDTHTEEVTQEFHETITPKGGCNVVLHHDTSPRGLHTTVYSKGDYTFSLCDVDPGSITIRKYDFHKDVFSCDDPEEVQLFNLNCTSAEMVFHIRNDEPKIRDDLFTTYADLTGPDHEAKTQSQTSKGWVIVDDLPYAERFAKAFRHAVELCGGKTSKF